MGGIFGLESRWTAPSVCRDGSHLRTAGTGGSGFESEGERGWGNAWGRVTTFGKGGGTQEGTGFGA